MSQVKPELHERVMDCVRDIENILNVFPGDPDVRNVLPAILSVGQKLKQDVDLCQNLEIISKDKLDGLMEIFTRFLLILSPLVFFFA